MVVDRQIKAVLVMVSAIAFLASLELNVTAVCLFILVFLPEVVNLVGGVKDH